MVRSSRNPPITEAISPWAIQQHDQLISLFPQIHPNTKKKPKQKKRANMQNQDPLLQPLPDIKSEFTPQTNRLPINTHPPQTAKGSSRVQQQYQQKIHPQHLLNFIKRSNRLSDHHSKSREFLHPKPLTSERKYVRASHYNELGEEAGCHRVWARGQQQMFKESSMNNNGQMMVVCGVDDRRLKDVHSVYLIERLKGISSTHEAIRNKPLGQGGRNNMEHVALFQYLSSQHGQKPNEKRVLTQRGPKLFNVKTQGNETQFKNSLNFIKKTSKVGNYMTHRKPLNNYNTLKSEGEMMRGFDKQKQNFNLEATFAQQKSIILHPCRQARSMEMKSEHNRSNLLRMCRMLNEQNGDLESRFAGISIQTGQSASSIQPPALTSNNNLTHQQPLIPQPSTKPKPSFSIQKSHFSLKPCINHLKEQKHPSNESQLNLQKQVRRNLRKLRGYLVKKTRDQCLERGNLDENRLLVCESSRNFVFRAQ